MIKTPKSLAKAANTTTNVSDEKTQEAEPSSWGSIISGAAFVISMLLVAAVMVYFYSYTGDQDLRQLPTCNAPCADGQECKVVDGLMKCVGDASTGAPPSIN